MINLYIDDSWVDVQLPGFNAIVVNILRVIPGRYYSADSKIWSIPIQELPVLTQRLDEEKFQYTKVEAPSTCQAAPETCGQASNETQSRQFLPQRPLQRQISVQYKAPARPNPK